MGPLSREGPPPAGPAGALPAGLAGFAKTQEKGVDDARATGPQSLLLWAELWPRLPRLPRLPWPCLPWPRGLAWCWSPDPALLLIPLSPPFFPAAWSPSHCLQRGQLTRAGSPGAVRVGTMLGTQVTAKRVVLSCSGRAEMLRNTPRPPESHSRTPRPAPTCTATPLPLLPLQPRGCPLLAP